MNRNTSGDELPDGCAIPIAIVALLVLIFMIGYMVVSPFHRETLTCTVEAKDRTSINGASSARVYTTDCGVLQVSDQWLAGTVNSADTYAQIREGRRYRFETTGWRIPVVSAFPNVVSVQEVGE